MAENVINDWVVQVGFDDKGVVAGVKKTEELLERLAKKFKSIQDLMGGSSGSSRPTGSPKSGSSPKSFSLSEVKKFNVESNIEDIMTRAKRSLGSTSEEFKKLNKQAITLKDSIAGISSNKGFAVLNRQVKRLGMSLTQTTKSMREQRTVAQRLGSSLKSLSSSYLSVFAVLGAVTAIQTTAMKFDALAASMLAASGSAVQAGKDMKFIEQVAFNTGTSLLNTAKGFQQIGTASRASGVSLDETKKQFTQMLKINKAFGNGTEDTKLVLLAFQQMISKGTVSAEELRLQLSERLPGSFSQAAIAMGVTTGELGKLLETGKLTTKEFLPKFLNQLEGFVDKSGAFEASLLTISTAVTRFNSALQQSTTDMFKSGLKGAEVSFLNRLTESIGELTPLFKIFGATFAAGLSAITFALDVLSVPLTFVSSALIHFVRIFEDAFDLTKANKKVSVFSNAIRLIAGLALFAVGGLQLLLGTIQLFASKLGADSEDFSTLTQILSSLVTISLAVWAAKSVAGLLGFRKSMSTTSDSAKTLLDRLTKISQINKGLGSGKGGGVGIPSLDLGGGSDKPRKGGLNKFGASPKTMLEANKLPLVKSVINFAKNNMIATGLMVRGAVQPLVMAAVAAPQISIPLVAIAAVVALNKMGYMDIKVGTEGLPKLGGMSLSDRAANNAKRFSTPPEGFTNTFNSEFNIEINAPNADSKEILDKIGEVVDDRFRDNIASLSSG